MDIRKHLSRFRRDTEGTSSIEFLLWVPVMVLMLTICTDATLLMHGHQELYNSARDASRQVALGQKTEIEAEAQVLARFGGDSAYTVDIAIVNGFVTSTVQAPFTKYSAFARQSGLFDKGTLSADVSMWVENYES